MIYSKHALVLLSVVAAHCQVSQAWDSDGSCPGCACDIRTMEEGGTATRFESEVAKTANKLLWSTNRTQGIFVRTPDGMEGTHLPGSHINVALQAPNPMYVFPPGLDSDIHCPPSGNECSGHPNEFFVNKCKGKLRNAYIYAGVGLLYGTKYSANEGHEAYVGGDIQADVEVCYPTDANTMDVNKRLWYDNAIPDQGRGGRGCHVNQDFGCNKEGTTCITKQDTACKCDFNAVPGKVAGEWMVTESLNQLGKGGTGRFQGAAQCAVNHNQIKQPSYQADFMSCWAEPADIDEIIDMSNSYWKTRDDWLNWEVPQRMPGDISYMGWTECSAQWGGKTDLKSMNQAADAILIVLPAMQNRVDTNNEPHTMSICDMSPEAIEGLETSLTTVAQGSKGLPVVVMEQTRGIDAKNCELYWDHEHCDDGYRKGIFSQNFLFPGGSCLKRKEDDPEVRFYTADEEICKEYKKYVDDRTDV